MSEDIPLLRNGCDWGEGGTLCGIPVKYIRDRFEGRIGLRFYDIPLDISIISGTDGSVLVEYVPAVDLSGNGFQFLCHTVGEDHVIFFK